MKLQMMMAGVVGIVIIVAGLFFYQTANNSKNEIVSTSSNQVSSDKSSSDTSSDKNVESIELEAVGEYTGNGTVDRTYDGENFVHLITAQIGPPSEEKFYEGWLVKGGVPISTGKMIADGDDYSLLFTSIIDYSDHNLVVITEETESLGLDGNPETHVLEGKFI